MGRFRKGTHSNSSLSGADQWSAPVSVSEDRHEMTLKFGSTPRRVDLALNRILPSAAGSHLATVVENERTTHVQLTRAANANGSARNTVREIGWFASS